MNMHEHYRSTVVPQLMEELSIANIYGVPRVEKVTLNMGVGESVMDRNMLRNAVEELALISGQQPVITKARKSVASFKIRQGFPIGCKVTLRRQRMYNFLERLVHIALPRVRDFRGLNPRSFDATGNYTFGVREQIIFTEIDFDNISRIRGLDICITTSARSSSEGLALLKALHFPFRS
ncbi:MAG: 50S ribosomal protein L5 [Gammaproteobacteria bacterium AqS3]|nr:50S ribosomal protein L5 [Gammaproteobacteria bacterium AqS3]